MLPSDSIYKKRFIYDHIQPLRDSTPLSDLLEGFWINGHPLIKDILGISRAISEKIWSFVGKWVKNAFSVRFTPKNLQMIPMTTFQKIS